MDTFYFTQILLFTYAICLAFNQVGAQDLETYNYTITKTWDNQTTPDNASISLSFSLQRDPDGYRSLRIQVEAPFYNDPKAPGNGTEEPFPGLWNYEVVEAFFLGENNEYLEVELAPSTHYILLYLKGRRNDTSMYLPIRHFTTQIINSTWIGEAFIPATYFPCNVTKFNAYAIHKSDPNRRYMSLFPVSEGEIPGPDFHYLDAFQQAPFLQEISPLCQAYDYNIKSTWNGNVSPDGAEIFLSFSIIEGTNERNKSMLMEINAPYFGDPEAPTNGTEENYPGLWEYEVVEAFFLGDDEKYLEIELAPSRHYLLLFLEGVRNDSGRYLPLRHYLAKIVNTTEDPTGEKQRWIGETHIPAEYFPCNVKKFNAYAIHKSGENRSYMSLFPVDEGEIEYPNFHYLSAFGNVTFDEEINSECVLKSGGTTRRQSWSGIFLTLIMTFVLMELRL